MFMLFKCNLMRRISAIAIRQFLYKITNNFPISHHPDPIIKHVSQHKSLIPIAKIAKLAK